MAAVSLDLSQVTREIRDRYQLNKRPQAVVETNPAIFSGQPVIRRDRPARNQPAGLT